MKFSSVIFVLFTLLLTPSFVHIPLPKSCPQAEKTNSPNAPIPSYKIETATKVFNRLKRSLGMLSSEKPDFHFVKKLPNSRLIAAMILFNSQSIYFEEKAYDLCTSFGKDSLNAMAIYLGHELAHFTGRHNVILHYTKDYGKDIKQDALFKQLENNLPEDQKDELLELVGKKMKKYTSAKNEKDADLQGGFIAYLAGYQTFGIAPQLLEKTYDDYRLNKNPEGYPSLDNRKQIAIDSDKKLKELIDLFEMGNYLVALNEFDDAILYFEKVLNQFKSREIYNNIGVLYTLSFLKIANKGKVKFVYPVELDADTRLNEPGSKSVHDTEKIKLLLALEYFGKASTLDVDYPIAHLNKSCAHALLGVYSEDKDLANEEYAIATAESLISRRLAKKNKTLWKKTLTDSYIQNGIIEALQGNKKEANILFEEALKISPKNHLAVVNQNILNEIKDNQELGFGGDGCSKKETIDDTPIESINITGEDVKAEIFKDGDNSIRLASKRLDHSQLMTNYVVEGSKVRYASFHLTDLDYNKTTQLGIQIDDDFQTIQAKYGDPDTYFELGQGSWLIYEDCKIIFQLDADGRLVRWSIYNHVL